MPPIIEFILEFTIMPELTQPPLLHHPHPMPPFRSPNSRPVDVLASNLWPCWDYNCEIITTGYIYKCPPELKLGHKESFESLLGMIFFEAPNRGKGPQHYCFSEGKSSSCGGAIFSSMKSKWCPWRVLLFMFLMKDSSRFHGRVSPWRGDIR